MNSDEKFMNLAIEKCKEGLKNGETPFGATIVKDGEVVVSTHNRVWSETNITSHAEIVAIREACKILNTIDLSGCIIYSTCEPCPMCFSAIHWAKIDKIFYGASIEDAKDSGFNELEISNDKMKREGKSSVIIVKNILQDECKSLFDTFNALCDKKIY
jgi:guanine deaminase